MPAYIMLSTLTEEGRKTVKEVKPPLDAMDRRLAAWEEKEREKNAEDAIFDFA